MKFFTRGKGKNRTVHPISPPKIPLIIVRPSRIPRHDRYNLQAQFLKDIGRKDLAENIEDQMKEKNIYSREARRAGYGKPLEEKSA